MPEQAVYQAIAHPTRRALLDLLAEREASVGTLASHFATSRPAVSQHLRVLREAGLVAEQAAGRERHYRATPAPLGEVAGWLGRYERFWNERLRRLGELLDEEDGA